MTRRSQTTTHVKVMDIGLEGHKGHGAEMSIEVHYTRTPDIPARMPDMHQPGEPAEGGEVEIVEVRPYRTVMDRGSQIKRKEYLDAPAWLLDLIRDCIDTDLLMGED